ncbi:MAG TPA: hypothetical protein PK397_07545 [Ignavibacteriaceae bacterium]|nr:hypothetical protein [Ignavibacteriaceae bacterium]
MKRINIILVTVIVLILPSCYTILNSKKIDEIFQREKPGFPNGAHIDQTLNGDWFGRPLAIADAPPPIQKLTFKSDGQFEFKSDSRSYRVYYGEYRALLDTIIINFDDKYNSEKYLYLLSNDTLYLTRFDMTTSYLIHCPHEKEIWTR